MVTKLTTVKLCQSYTVSDKLRIIQFAEQHSNRAAECEFGVSKSNVRLWRKSKENLEKMPRLKRANRGKLFPPTFISPRTPCAKNKHPHFIANKPLPHKDLT